MRRVSSRASRPILIFIAMALTVGFGPAACRDQFQVNPVVDSRDEEGHLGAHHNVGAFVVVWEHWQNSVPGSDVMGQRFDAEGQPEGAAFQINSSSGRDGSPEAAMSSAGVFVVVWIDDDSEQICARKYAEDGSAITGELVVAASGDFNRFNPAVAIGDDGSFMVVWEESIVDPDEGSLPADIWARYYNASATGSPEMMVNIETAGDQLSPTVAGLVGGGWVIAWQGAGGITARRYTATGSSVTAELTLNSEASGFQSEPDLTELPDGGYAAAWRGAGFGADDDGIQMRRFSSSDVASGPEIQVNFHTDSWQALPEIDADSQGNLVVAWESGSSAEGDTDESSIQARIYRADGSRHLQQFQVNTLITGAQVEPAIAFSVDLSFPFEAVTAVWTDVVEADPETTLKNVQAKVYDLRVVIFADDFETGDVSYW